MTIAFTGSGGLFPRLGKIGKVLGTINTFQATTLPTDIRSLETQFSGEDLVLIDNVERQLLSAQNVAGSYMNYLQQVAIDTVNKMVLDDNPQLSDTDLDLSMREVIRQMQSTSNTVKACTCTISASASPNNIGNGVLVGSVKGFDGLVEENLFAENLTATVTQDQNDSEALEGNETFTVTTQVGYDPFDWRFPLGSEATTSLSAINATQDNDQGNILTNSDFEDFTTNVPDNWTLASGVAGTTCKASANAYTGASAVQFVGTAASALTTLTQTFDDSTDGTAGDLAALAQYAFNTWLFVDTPLGNSGVLTISLIDGSGNTVNDYQGTANTTSKTLSTLSASAWTSFDGVFRTPQVMPDTLKVKMGLSTPLINGTNLYIDRLGFGNMTQVYAGGPSLAIFSGSSSFYNTDFITVTTTNDRAGATNNLTFQTLFDRLFDMRDLGLILPTASGGSISDSLIS